MAFRLSRLNCILPPYILANIAERGTDAQRTVAVNTLQASQQFREERQTIAKEVIAPQAPAVGGLERIVYTAENQSTLPGKVVRREGEPPVGDAAVDEAYEGAGATYELYNSVYNRNSIDGKGMRLDLTVHYQRNYDNAFWNGEQMVYGDGDEGLPPQSRLFNRFTIALDVIGHELTHGVTQYTSDLTYSGQSGALNESFSDVFGSLVKQYRLRQQASEADWIIGQGLFTSNVNGVGIRSMSAPGTAYDDPVLGKDPQPGHMSNYVETTEDNGGVHINSGIPNHAFYLAAMKIGGYAWEKAGQVWYVTLRDKIQASASFQDVANLTYAAAGELYGANSLEQNAVAQAWKEVGLPVSDSKDPGCLPGIFKSRKS